MRPSRENRFPRWDVWTRLEISAEALRPLYSGLLTLRALVDMLNDNLNQVNTLLQLVCRRIAELERQIRELSDEVTRSGSLLEAEIRNLEGRVARLESSQTPKLEELLKQVDLLTSQTKSCLLLTEELGASIRKGIGELSHQLGRQYALGGDISSRLSRMDSLISYRMSNLELLVSQLSNRVAELEALIKSLKSEAD